MKLTDEINPSCHRETGHVICTAIKWLDFYVKCNTRLKWVHSVRFIQYPERTTGLKINQKS